MRLLAVLRALKPRVWITTPQGALDFLARLYLEFNVDPMELDLELIVVVGEIAPAGAHRRIEDEFESDVADLYCDPFFGAALAARRSGRVSLPDPTTLGLARVAEDEDEKAALGDPIPGLAELVIRPSWCAPLAGTTLRTGQLTGAAGTGLFQHTIGEHLLQVWFMNFQQPLLIGFCDGMGIDHNGEGSVEGELPAEMDTAKLKETVDGLYTDFNPKVVSLYLYLFNLQRPGGWDALADTLANDGRIVLGIDPEPRPESEGAPAGEAEPEEAPEAEPEGEPDVPEEE